jgi:hypothetical protein
MRFPAAAVTESMKFGASLFLGLREGVGGEGVSHLLLTFVDLGATSTAPANASTISAKTEVAAGVVSGCRSPWCDTLMLERRG